jgi:hypothetical protein
MLKRDITYEDFNGETVTDTFYFNLTKTEIIQLQFGYEGGLEAAIRKIIEAEDGKSLIEEFQKIVLAAYGVKSDDGKRFIKSEQLREEFSQTAAYDALFMDLATNEDSAADFVKGVVPKDLTAELEKLGAQPQPAPSNVVDVPLPPAPPRPA